MKNHHNCVLGYMSIQTYCIKVSHFFMGKWLNRLYRFFFWYQLIQWYTSVHTYNRYCPFDWLICDNEPHHWPLVITDITIMFNISSRVPNWFQNVSCHLTSQKKCSVFFSSLFHLSTRPYLAWSRQLTY